MPGSGSPQGTVLGDDLERPRETASPSSHLQSCRVKLLGSERNQLALESIELWAICSKIPDSIADSYRVRQVAEKGRVVLYIAVDIRIQCRALVFRNEAGHDGDVKFDGIVREAAWN